MLFSETRFRPNVAGILRNPAGEILICERLGMPGAWQFPQGGVDEGETQEEALERELREEISIKRGDFRVVEKHGPYRYLFPGGREKRGFRGNEQHYFLAEFTGSPDRIKMDTKKPEFQAHRWIKLQDFRLHWLPEMKREVYRAVLHDFFGLKL